MEVLESKNLVTMSNELARASYRLTVNEIRLLLVAMSQMPKGDNDEPMDENKPYYITKDDFIRLGVAPATVAREIRSACRDLMDRKVFIDTPLGDYEFHWTSNVLHFKSEKFEELKRKYPTAKYDEDFIESLRLANLLDSLPIITKGDDNVIARVVFSKEILPYISQLKKAFTQLKLEDLAGFSSFYSFRIYMMMMQFMKTNYVIMKLDEFRKSLDLVDKYEAVKDLKKRVLDVAISEISEKSPYTAQYDLTDKDGKSGKGVKLTHVHIKFKAKEKSLDNNGVSRDPDTTDLFTKLTDKQLARVVHSQKFMADYGHLVSPQNPANQSSNAWIEHMITWLKKDPDNFSKRPLQEYLDDKPADRFGFNG